MKTEFGNVSFKNNTKFATISQQLLDIDIERKNLKINIYKVGTLGEKKTNRSLVSFKKKKKKLSFEYFYHLEIEVPRRTRKFQIWKWSNCQFEFNLRFASSVAQKRGGTLRPITELPREETIAQSSCWK